MEEILMRNLSVLTAISAALMVGAASVAFSADIVGTIGGPGGKPIPGVQVSVDNQSGVTVGSATSDTLGRYEFRGLQPGTYTLNSSGQSAVSYVGPNGVTVNWGVTPNAPAIATAHVGTGSSVNDLNSASSVTQLAASTSNGNCQGDNNNGNGQNGNGNCDHHKSPHK
jgi:Carboxypeptidase regulatory-like domain